MNLANLFLLAHNVALGFSLAEGRNRLGGGQNLVGFEGLGIIFLSTLALAVRGTLILRSGPKSPVVGNTKGNVQLFSSIPIVLLRKLPGVDQESQGGQCLGSGNQSIDQNVSRARQLL